MVVEVSQIVPVPVSVHVPVPMVMVRVVEFDEEKLAAVTLLPLASKVPADIVIVPLEVILLPSVFVPVPEEVIASKVIVPEFNVALPLPEKVVVEVPPMVNVPTRVNNVPDVPVTVKVALWMSRVPLVSISTFPVLKL